MHFLRIVLFCIASAVVYGIVHDQITVRVCIEYFTVGHPPIFGGITDPTLLGVAWGILATWWVGLFLGVLLAMSACIGAWPKVEGKDLVRPVFVLLGIMAIGAVTFGFLGWFLGNLGLVVLFEPLEFLVPTTKHALFLGAMWAHLASYAIGFFGGTIVNYRVLRVRRKRFAQKP